MWFAASRIARGRTAVQNRLGWLLLDFRRQLMLWSCVIALIARAS
jgi:hypothetical protein